MNLLFLSEYTDSMLAQNLRDAAERHERRVEDSRMECIRDVEQILLAYRDTTSVPVASVVSVEMPGTLPAAAPAETPAETPAEDAPALELVPVEPGTTPRPNAAQVRLCNTCPNKVTRFSRTGRCKSCAQSARQSEGRGTRRIATSAETTENGTPAPEQAAGEVPATKRAYRQRGTPPILPKCSGCGVEIARRSLTGKCTDCRNNDTKQRREAKKDEVQAKKAQERANKATRSATSARPAPAGLAADLRKPARGKDTFNPTETEKVLMWSDKKGPKHADAAAPVAAATTTAEDGEPTSFRDAAVWEAFTNHQRDRDAPACRAFAFNHEKVVAQGWFYLCYVTTAQNTGYATPQFKIFLKRPAPEKATVVERIEMRGCDWFIGNTILGRTARSLVAAAKTAQSAEGSKA